MKKNLLALFSSLLFISIAQAQISVRGVVFDSVKHEAFAYVTVSLANSQTGKPIKSTLTADNGSFQLKDIPVQPLKLSLSYVGYLSKTISLTEKTGTIDLGRINLSPANGQLKEVSVLAVKPVLKREIDRLSYDVQADPDSRTFTTLEMLRKVPLISIDGYEKIKLKGSGSFKILINGRESAITAQSPEEALKAMPALSVERIEVITTPPAKYDGEGLAGLINIVTKQNVGEGYNVNSNLRYNSVYGPVANTTLTTKKGKLGVTGFVSYSYRDKLTNPLGSTRETYTPVSSMLTQDGEYVTDKGHHTEDIVNVSYDIDSLNLITAGYVNFFENQLNQYDQNLAERDGNGALTQQYHSFADGADRSNSTSAELNYQQGFKRNKQQQLTVGYKFDNSNYNSSQDVHFSNQVNYTGPNYRQISQTITHEHTAQVDYSQPFGKFMLETGGKAIFRDNASNYQYGQLVGDAYTPVAAMSNQYSYKQQVYSAYGSGRYTAKNYVAKAGLRLEQTHVDADFATSAQGLIQNYSTLLPSFSVQRNFKNSSITLGAANRLQRPNIWDLNPFVDRTNPKFLVTGNPNLAPIIMHTFELNYVNNKHHNITAGISYQTTSNNIENIRTVLPDTVNLRQPKNAARLKYLTVNGSINMALTKKWKLNTNGQVDYANIKGSDNNGQMHNEGAQANLSLDSSYNFSNGLRVSTNASYNTSYVEFQGHSNFYFYSSFRVSKEMANKKLQLTLTANNPYSQRVTLHGSSYSPEFYRDEHYNDYYRNIGFNLTYKFGGLSSDIKKTEHKINNDDLRGGGKS